MSSQSPAGFEWLYNRRLSKGGLEQLSPADRRLRLALAGADDLGSFLADQGTEFLKRATDGFVIEGDPSCRAALPMFPSWHYFFRAMRCAIRLREALLCGIYQHRLSREWFRARFQEEDEGRIPAGSVVVERRAILSH